MDFVPDPVDHAAQAAAPHHRGVHVGLIEEPVEGKQFDQARILRQKPRSLLSSPQLAIAARRFDEQREFVPFGGQRANQLAGEMKNAALVVRLAESLADNQYLFHARRSSSSNWGFGRPSSRTVRTTRP